MKIRSLLYFSNIYIYKSTAHEVESGLEWLAEIEHNLFSCKSWIPKLVKSLQYGKVAVLSSVIG